MGTDFFQKVIRYRMHGTCTRFSGYSSLLSLPFLSAPTSSATFFPISVTGVEIAETDTSFLAPFWILETFIQIMSLLMAGKALNLEDAFFVFSIFFDNVGVYTCCGKVVVSTLLPTSAPKTSLVLVFLAHLALVCGRLLVFATRCISRGSISELNSSRIFFFILYELVYSETPWVHLVNTGR